MSFRYLTDKNRCPVCFVRREFNTGNCHNCGVRLFRGTFNRFDEFEEETGIVNWWAWHDEATGWRHRDYYMVENAKPQERIFEMPKIEKNYGRTETPDSIRAKKAQTKRIVKKQGMMKINPRQALSSRAKN